MKIVHRKQSPTDPVPPKKRRGIAVVVVMMAAAVAGAALIASIDRLGTTPPPETDPVAVTTAPSATTRPTTAVTTTLRTTTTTSERAVAATTATTAVGPLYVLPLSNRVVTPFSKTPVWNETMQSYRVHTAVDLGGEVGDRVVALADCTVKEVWSDVLWGECITLDAGYGVIATYCGVTTDCRIGDTLSVNQPIGTLSGVPCEENGDTVLHVELSVDGEPIDLMKALDRLGQ